GAGAGLGARRARPGAGDLEPLDPAPRPGGGGGASRRGARRRLGGRLRRGTVVPVLPRRARFRPGALARRRGIPARRGFVAGLGLPAARPVIPGTRVVAGTLTGPGQRPVQFLLVELRRVERL